MASGVFWRTWTIIKSTINENGEKELYFKGSFSSRRLCEEYLKFKKEQYFFETGSMEEAEKEWGIDNFVIDCTITLDRIMMLSNFNLNLEDWN